MIIVKIMIIMMFIAMMTLIKMNNDKYDKHTLDGHHPLTLFGLGDHPLLTLFFVPFFFLSTPASLC